jgi:hypothetical protein
VKLFLEVRTFVRDAQPAAFDPSSQPEIRR